MSRISQLVLDFYPADKLPSEEGLKFAVFKLMEGQKVIGYDYGFANFEKGEFETLSDSGRLGIVVKWCELPTTKLLI